MNRSGDPGEGEAVAAEGLRARWGGTALAGIGYALSQILTLASYLVLARLATPTEFGQFTAGAMSTRPALHGVGHAVALVYRRDRLEEAAAAAGRDLPRRLDLRRHARTRPVIGSFFDSETITGVAAAASDLPSCERFP